MGDVVEFARPFRMTDFFLIAGLFLASRIDAPVAALPRPEGAALRLFLRALAHHPVRLQGARLRGRDGLGRGGAGISGRRSSSRGARSGSSITWRFSWSSRGFLKNVPWPYRLGRGVAALEMAPIHTGSVLIDEFASRFVYFYSGYVFAGFRVSVLADRRPSPTHVRALMGLALWAVAERPHRVQRPLRTGPS